MYEQYFGLDCRPFDLAPDPRFMFLTPQHSRAVANVRFAIMNCDSFVIITGEIGIGKTTVLNTVIAELGPEYVTAKLTHTTLNHIELLQALLSDFGMPMYTKKKVLLLDTLRSFFLEQHAQGKHVVIIVDEAQNLSGPALEELRLLSCIDTADRNIVSIVLTGQRGLDDLIDAPGLIQLRQRARLRQQLHALSEADTYEYIAHRMKVAGGNRDKIFNHDAIEEIHRLCFGIPRLINTLCDTALLTCLAEEKRKVTLDVIDSAVQELRWQWIEDRDADEEVVSSIDRESSKTNSPINLMVYRSGQFVEQVQPTHFPFVLGRSNANDMVIIDKEVSRRHALIDCIGGIYVVEDLNSKNGILVNRKQRSRALLRSGDIVSFGQIDVAFYNNAAESTANIPTKLPPAPMREDDENDENDENSEQDADPSSTVNDLTKITDKKQA